MRGWRKNPFLLHTIDGAHGLPGLMDPGDFDSHYPLSGIFVVNLLSDLWYKALITHEMLTRKALREETRG